jgi:FAD synthase
MLGFPTANLDVRWDKEQHTEELTAAELDILRFAQQCEPGIYCAWAQVADGDDSGVYKAAMSIGWNPTFDDVKVKTIEPWILHNYDSDFYGKELRLAVAAYIRPELKFENFDTLVDEIRQDGEFCAEALDSPELAYLAHDPVFKRQSVGGASSRQVADKQAVGDFEEVADKYVGGASRL